MFSGVTMDEDPMEFNNMPEVDDDLMQYLDVPDDQSIPPSIGHYGQQQANNLYSEQLALAHTSASEDPSETSASEFSEAGEIESIPAAHLHRSEISEIPEIPGDHRSMLGYPMANSSQDDRLRAAKMENFDSLGASDAYVKPEHEPAMHGSISSESRLEHMVFGGSKPPPNYDINKELPPHDYANILAKGADPDLPFAIHVSQFPARSRVETQIKCRLSVTPPPSQVLIRLPPDTLARPRFQLADPSSIQDRDDILHLDVDAVVPENPDERIFMCAKCLSRERKRAFRKKTLDPHEELSWHDDNHRRLLIFNCKEIVELPEPINATIPSGEEVEVRELDLPLRLACYCRHHSAKNGYVVVFSLRDRFGKLVGQGVSTPVFITDNHKEPRSSDDRRSSVKGAVHPHPYSRPSHQPRSRSNSTVSSDWSISSASQINGGLTSHSASSSTLPSPPSAALSPATSSAAIGSPASDNLSGSGSASNRRSYGAGAYGSLTGTAAGNPPHVANSPSIQRIIPASGSIRGGVEVTLLGSGFQPGLIALFGENAAISTQCWSDSTIIAHLPPAQQAGPVAVTFQDYHSASAIFTYIDDGEQKLKELALQVVGFKFTGRIEEAGDIAQRILETSEPGSFGSIAGGSQGRGNVDGNGNPSPSAEQLALGVLKLVQQRGRVPNLNLRNSEGQTMMHLAAMMGYAAVVRQLLAQGATASSQDVSGFTPLHFAALFGQRHITRLLLDCGDVDPFHRTLAGQTVAQIADPTVLDLLPRDQRSYYQDLNSRSSSCSSLLALASSPSQSASAPLLTPHASPPTSFNFDNDSQESINSLVSRKPVSNMVRSQSSSSHDPPAYSQLYPSPVFSKTRSEHSPPRVIELDVAVSEGSAVESELDDDDLGLGDDYDDDDDEDDDDDGDEPEPARDEELLKRWAANPLKQIHNDRMLLTFWLPVFLIAFVSVLYVLLKDHLPARKPNGGKILSRRESVAATNIVRSFAENLFT